MRLWWLTCDFTFSLRPHMVNAMSNLDYLIQRLREVRWMRETFDLGDDDYRYRDLTGGCEACSAPPGEHWGDCNRDDPDRAMLTEYLR